MALNVISVPAKQTHEWLLKKHYAKRIPVINYSFGLYFDGMLKGICTFGRPASPPLCVGICGEDYKDYVFELNRLVIDDDMPKGTASYFVGSCLRQLPGNMIVVSFADTEQGHIGIVYQATNFLYTGLSDKHLEWRMVGSNKHSKNVCKEYSLEERINNPNLFYQVERPRKHRYIYFIGSKSFRNKARKALRYSIEPYPKGKTQRYDASYQPAVQQQLFG